MTKRSTEEVLRAEVSRARKARERADAELARRTEDVKTALEAKGEAQRAVNDADAAEARAERALEAFLPPAEATPTEGEEASST